MKRALAYQRLISDAFHAKLVVEDDRCYLTNGEQPWAENLVNRHFSECAMSGILRFFKFITEGRFEPIYIDFNFSKGAFDDEYFRVYECPVSLGQKETRLYFDPSILAYPLWQTIKENAINNDRNRQAQSVITSCKEKGMSYRQIAEYLNELNFKTRYGNQFMAPTVHQLYRRTLLKSAC